jgi:hypothetical protein
MRSATSASMSADKIARGRERNRAWCATNRSVRNRNAWLLGAPPFALHLPGGGFELHVSPAPQWPIVLRNTRALHGLVTQLLGIGHHPTIPGFTLVPWPTAFGWAVYSQHDVSGVAGREHAGQLFDREVVVRCGPYARVRAPVIARRGRRVLRVDAVTPVLVRCGDHRAPATYTAPTAANLHSTLDAWLPRRIGVESFGGDLCLSLLSREVQPTLVATGGKFGDTRGWVGHVVVETNAVGHWLLELAARIGLGGRVALGFGRVRVSAVG